MLKHSKEAKLFYKSRAWIKCRASYIVSVHGICERCLAPGYIVHHKEHINFINIQDPNVTLNHDNLEYLCKTCHNQEHFKKHEAIREGLIFDENGNLQKSDTTSTHPPHSKRF